MSQASSGYKRSTNGLVGAIIVSLLFIAVVWGLSRFQQHDPIEAAPTVDYSASLAQARAEAPFPVLAPYPVPPGWRATSATWNGAGPLVSWHLGLLTGEGAAADYVGLDQGNEITRDFLAATTRADQPGSPVTIGGDTWDAYTSADGGEAALVLERNGVTTIVSGTADESVLQAYAASLSAR